MRIALPRQLREALYEGSGDLDVGGTAVEEAIADRVVAELPDSTTVEAIVRQVANLTGLTIEVEPLGDEAWESVTGLLLIRKRDQFAKILIRISDPRWYQLHVVLHELAHLLYGHTGCSTLPSQFDNLLHPGSLTLARSVGTPTGPHREQEHEAETLAHRLAKAVLSPRFEADESIFG